MFYRWDAGDLELMVRVTPRARREGADGLLRDRLRVRVSAPPLEGKANDAVRRYLASQFGVSRSRIEITRGAKGVDKTVRIHAPSTLPEWFITLGGTRPSP